jgi:hypothetical protein
MLARIHAALGVLLAGALAASAAPVRVPGSAHPAAVVALGALDGIAALAVADDGSAAVGAFASAKAGRSIVRFARADGGAPAEIPVRGRVRALRFARDGESFFVVAAREPKRGPHETFLVRVETATLDASREIVLPRGAADADGPDGATLLVVSDAELRTFRLPALTSGRLYRIDGRGRAIAAIPGTRRVLIGREDGIALVDLDDPQTRDGLGARARLATGAPVVALAIAPDAAAALARLEDGRVVRFRVEPLGDAVEDGTARAIAWPGERAQAPVPEPERPAPPKPEPVPPPLPEPEPPPVPRPVPPAEPAPVPEPEPSPEPEPPPPPEPSPEPSFGVARPAEPVVASAEAGLRGRVTGGASAEVVAVVVFGPDNMLREAARVRPGPDGAWSATGLAPGAYRIVLDGGGGKVLEVRPAFRTVRLGAGALVDVASMEALRSL